MNELVGEKINFDLVGKKLESQSLLPTIEDTTLEDTDTGTETEMSEISLLEDELQGYKGILDYESACEQTMMNLSKQKAFYELLEESIKSQINQGRLAYLKLVSTQEKEATFTKSM